MTPHNRAKKNEFAKTVIMPGDPLRAKLIAEEFLEDAKLISDVRNIYAYTGTYKGKRVSVMASGMGIPSMAIYSYELYSFYGVENIIRVGTVGSFKEDVHVKDMILVNKSITNSNFASSFSNTSRKVESSSSILNKKIKNASKELDMKLHFGNIYSSDTFYSVANVSDPLKEEHDCLGVEMESFALFHVAKCLNKEAATLLTVSDSLVTKEELSSEEREKNVKDMLLLALESVL